MCHFIVYMILYDLLYQPKGFPFTYFTIPGSFVTFWSLKDLSLVTSCYNSLNVSIQKMVKSFHSFYYDKKHFLCVCLYILSFSFMERREDQTDESSLTR